VINYNACLYSLVIFRGCSNRALLVTLRSALEGDALAFALADALIPHYWIVDPIAREMHVMELQADRSMYSDVVTVEAGNEWHAEEPFRLEFDPAEFC
jgi:hypothetical protein